MASLKTCFKCGVEKPRTEFYAHQYMKDGLLGKCKECAKKDVRQHRAANDSVREYDRKRSVLPHRVELRKKINERWKEFSPERKKASQLVNYAIRTGAMKKQPCFVCGEVEVEGHHPDYSRPLDVVWLCVRHHRILHAQHNYGVAA